MIQVTIPVKLIFSVEVVSGTLWLSVSAGCQSILLIRRTFNTWVCPQGTLFAQNAGATGDLSDNLYTAVRSY